MLPFAEELDSMFDNRDCMAVVVCAVPPPAETSPALVDVPLEL